MLALADGNADEETLLDVRSSSAGSQSRRTLRSHTSASRSPKRTEVAVPSAAAEEVATFGIGAAVVITGMQPPREDLNWKTGTVLKYSPGDLSYTLRVDQKLVTVASNCLVASNFQLNAAT